MLLFILLSTLVCCTADLLPNAKVKGVLGKMVKFDTVFDGSKGYVTLSWNFEDENIATATSTAVKVVDAYQDRVKLNATTGVMELGPLAATDSGTYKLNIVTTDVETLTGETVLEVLEPVSDVVITADPTGEAVETNNTVVLTCKAKGSFLKYSWLNGTVPVAADGKRLVLNTDGSVLTIKDVERWDLTGPMYCRVGNDLEVERSAPFNMTVSYGPENVVLVQTPKAAILSKGANVSLACSSVSSPPATYQWFFKGQPLADITTMALTLSNVEEKDAGNYSCMATNAKTKRFTPSETVTFAVIEALTSAKITREGAASQLIAKNSSITLGCAAASGKVGSIVWTKDNVPLTTSDRVVLSAQKDKLTIKVVQRGDEGQYKCEMMNAVSKVADIYNMVVNYGPDAVEVSGPEEVEIHDPVTIECKAESHPAATYSWKLNSTKLDVTSSTVVIKEPRFRDGGIYTCTVFNPITNHTATNTHRLYVREEGALDEGLSGGAVAGIIIGVLIALGILIAVVLHMRRKKEIPSPY